MNTELISWLNDAYAMETGLVPILQNHARDAAGDAAAVRRLEQHVEETRRHASEIENCIKHLGGRVSTVRATLSTVLGTVESLATAPFRDEVVKNMLMDFASENFEIACYKALIVAAREAGRDEVVRTCEEILQDEEEMAYWLESQIPKAVRSAIAPRAS